MMRRVVALLVVLACGFVLLRTGNAQVHVILCGANRPISHECLSSGGAVVGCTPLGLNQSIACNAVALAISGG